MNSELESQLADAQDSFVWESHAYERRERGPRWYVIMSLVALLFVAYSVWTANFLFAFLILLAAIVLILAGNEHPSTTLAQVGHNGIVWDGEFVPFEKIKHFAIVYQPPNIKVLYITPKGFYLPRLRIPLGDQNPIELRDHLKQYLVEDLELRDEHASDMLARLFRL